MQTRNDGKHVILPAAAPIDRRPDRARMPVMMPRQSDGKLHRDGSGAATVQPKHPVAECGRVHGASELQANERQRIAEYRFVYYRIQKEKRRWTRSLPKHDRLRGQDKRPHIAAWTVGCFDWLFSNFPHIADHKCDVRTFSLSNVFNETRTSL